MDFAIAPIRECGAEAWEVLCLADRRGQEVAARLASFAHRGHAEAFLADLLAMPVPAPGPS
jgi:hypothetical protein